MKRTLKEPYNEYKVRANLDTNYGTYDSVEEVLRVIPLRLRRKGRTVGVIEDGSVVEYWFKSGIEDSDLVVKSEGGGTTGDYIPLTGTEEGKPVTGSISTEGDFYINSLTAEVENSIGWFENQTLELNTDFLETETSVYRNVNVGFDGKILENGIDGESLDVSVLTIQTMVGNGVGAGIVGIEDYSNSVPNNKLIYTQRSYVDKANSYFTEETKTGGTWIDGKDIYTITQLTTDHAPTVDTMIKSIVVGGSYTEYEYTKLAE